MVTGYDVSYHHHNHHYHWYTPSQPYWIARCLESVQIHQGDLQPPALLAQDEHDGAQSEGTRAIKRARLMLKNCGGHGWAWNSICLTVVDNNESSYLLKSIGWLMLVVVDAAKQCLVTVRKRLIMMVFKLLVMFGHGFGVERLIFYCSSVQLRFDKKCLLHVLMHYAFL